MWGCDKDKPCVKFCESKNYQNECGIRRKDMSLTKNLRFWRESRNITQDSTEVYVANIIEELLEIYYDDKDIIKKIQREIIFEYFNSKKELNQLNTIDAIQDIQVFSVNETELKGYDNEHANYEVFKEINSRKQDPDQMIDWAANGAKGKWLKDKLQDKNTLYKADYEFAKTVKGMK